MILGQRFPGGADGVQRIRLGAAAPRGPLRPADLDHPLAMGPQRDGEPSAVAAGALHRPTTPSGHLRHPEVEQLLIPGRIRSD
jgi:hypothetical protein